MPRHNTYSFTDLEATISHPSYGVYSAQGEGVGDITIAKLTDRTVHDVAADGNIMISKIAGNNGNITINAQQVSTLNDFLQGLFNYLWNAPTDEWAGISITIRSPKMKKTYYCTGGAFVKEPDEQFQAQGQKLPWVLTFADIQRIPL